MDRWPPRHRRAGVGGLLDEARSAKSALVSLPGQGLQRVVFVCSLKLCRDDGSTLVQVGEWTARKGTTPDLVLPGLKSTRSALPQEALQRLLQGHLSAFADGIVLSQTQHAMQEAEHVRMACWIASHISSSFSVCRSAPGPHIRERRQLRLLGVRDSPVRLMVYPSSARIPG